MWQVSYQSATDLTCTQCAITVGPTSVHSLATGRLIEHDGKLLRLGRRCRHSRGDRVVPLEVMQLSATAFVEASATSDELKLSPIVTDQPCMICLVDA